MAEQDYWHYDVYSNEIYVNHWDQPELYDHTQYTGEPRRTLPLPGLRRAILQNLCPMPPPSRPSSTTPSQI